MADELLTYYERELSFLRQLGAEYAAKYPKIAGRLLLEGDKCEDPHVERLIEAFAFLAARVHHKIDDELPEITEALLNVVYPHYLNPVPSSAIVQLVLDPEQGKLTTGHRIERGAMLYSQPVDGHACRFQTCYPVTLWPIEVVTAQVDTTAHLGLTAQGAAVIRLELRCLGGTAFPTLQLDDIRFYLHGESRLAYALYELLLNNVREVRVRPAGSSSGRGTVVLPPECLRPVGFNAEEGLLPYSHRSFLGYRLLQEYFALPEKFLFIDLTGLGSARQALKDRMEVLIVLDRTPRFEQPMSADTFRLGCTPIVNLFEQLAEPIRLSQTQTEYRVVPDVRRQLVTEVYSVDTVTSTNPATQETAQFEPFYSIRHTAGRRDGRAYWYTTRRPSHRKLDTGTEVFLTLVDLDFKPTLPAADTLSVRATCTNRDLPAKLPFGGERSDFALEGAAPLARIRCLTKPRETLRAPLRSAAQWRLISHLSLNYLSITDTVHALQEILRLYDFSDSLVVQQQIAGITDLQSRRIVARPASMPWNGFCRGIEVTLEFDEERYVGSGLFLFASVLERFLGLYASLNSFVQTIATTKQRGEPLHRWPPRAGSQILL